MKDTEKFAGAKYVIKAQFKVDGVVEKHDVIGAIFGQTEGLFPKEFELRELQKSGKIGRIDITLKSSKDSTTGEIIAPSSLDRAETAIVAAAMETVDRVGPCEANINIEQISDVRSEKRAKIIARAKELMRDWVVKEGQDIEKLLDEENATVMTADCYGSVFESLCQAYAYPCIGFTRLNDMGLGGICQSDLPCAMTHILFQGLSGRPGFVNNPGFDFHDNTAILIHCLGSCKMDGPDGPSAPYKLRSIMEREEGAVPQVIMRTGQKVTQAVIADTSKLLYFTGTIIDTPESERGCRTKITVDVDGSSEKLWQNWSDGIHRVTCYGDITKELRYFCRYKEIEMINEAV